MLTTCLKQFCSCTIKFTTVLLTVVLATTASAADGYPSKNINWVVMWSAGGGADTATRTFTKYLEEELDQKIIIKNIVGGGASIGYLTAKSSRKDGYNLVTIQGDLPKYLPMELAPINIDDFDIIASFAVQSPILIARADSPWKDLAAFVEDAKRNPGKFTIGVSDIGGVHHQPLVLWAEEAGIDIRVMAHSGSPQMNAAILGGHVDLISSYVRPALPYIKEGDLQSLGYFGTSRPTELPDTPTFKELGYDVVWEQPYGLGGPAGMPEAAIQKLTEATKKVWDNPKFSADLSKLGLDPYFISGPELKQNLTRMQKDIGEILQILSSEQAN